MKILAVAQTQTEWSSICQKAERTKGAEFYILRLGAAATQSKELDVASNSNIKSLFLKDLNLSYENIWKKYEQIKTEFRNQTEDSIKERLHLVVQIDYEGNMFCEIFARTTISVALDKIEPDEIYIPPQDKWNEDSKFCVRHLQTFFYQETQNRKINSRIAWSARVHFSTQPIKRALQQVIFSLSLIGFDLKRFWNKFFSRQIDTTEYENAVFIINAEQDLSRQFDLEKFAKKTKEKCVVWNQQTDEILFLENLLNKEKTPETLTAEHISQKASVHSATKLAKNYLSKSFFSPLAGKSKNEPSDIQAVFAERLQNWRRITYAARLVANGLDVLSVLNPKLLIASDSTDTSRAISLAAREQNVKILASSHGINLFNEPMPAMFALGDVHCLFGQKTGHLIGEDVLSLTSKRIVAHDSMGKVTKKKEASESKQKKCVFILTSPFMSTRYKNWTNEIFVDRSKYVESLERLLKQFEPHSDELEFVIKSHPHTDEHEVYEDLKTKFPKLLSRHWREPIDLSKPIPADLLVLFNSISTLTLSIIEQGVPVIVFWNSLTSLCLNKVTVSELIGTNDMIELGKMITEILNFPKGETAKKAKEHAEIMRNRFVEQNDNGLAEMVEFTLNLKGGD